MRVALDATPLLGNRTGVAAFCLGALSGLGAREDLDVGAYAVSWRRRGAIVGQLPGGVEAVGRPMPARPLQASWRRGSLPPAEWLLGGRDVIHGTNFVVPPARRAARVVTVHDLTALKFPQMCEPASLRFPDLVRRAVARGAWVHTPSEWVAGEVVEWLGVDPRRVRAVHHGAGALAGAGGAGGAGVQGPLTEASTGFIPEGRYVLALGTVEPRKDLVGLVRAFEQLAGERPDVSLVIAGADGWGAQALDAAVRESPFLRRVIRLGYVSRSHRDVLVAGAAVLAYPSVYEGFGLPPLEAMTQGVPVVATRAGALVEVLGDGAELVAVGDEPGLAGAIAHLLDDPDAATALGARGRLRAEQFTWERCAEGLARLYRDALAERQG
ncbi:MAG: glycosyltransferase family 4 protein [Acidimicrobiales bacterium]